MPALAQSTPHKRPYHASHGTGNNQFNNDIGASHVYHSPRNVVYSEPNPNHNVPYGQSCESGHNVPSQTGTTWQFANHNVPVNWKKLAQLDFSLMTSSLDHQVLQDNIMTVAFCRIQDEFDLRYIDMNLAKLFRLSQLTVQYLLHSQEYLTQQIKQLNDKTSNHEEAYSTMDQKLSKKSQEVKALKAELKKSRVMLQAQQELLQQAAAPTPVNHSCPCCAKSFISNLFLQAHIRRRHPEAVEVEEGGRGAHSRNGRLPAAEQGGNSGQGTGTMPMSMQELENTAMKDKHRPPVVRQKSTTSNDQLSKELFDIKERLRMTERQLSDERMARSKEQQQQEREQEQHKDRFKEWTEEQQELLKSQLESIKSVFKEELKEVQEKQMNAEIALMRMAKLQEKKAKRDQEGIMSTSESQASTTGFVTKNSENRGREFPNLSPIKGILKKPSTSNLGELLDDTEEEEVRKSRDKKQESSSISPRYESSPRKSVQMHDHSHVTNDADESAFMCDMRDMYSQQLEGINGLSPEKRCHPDTVEKRKKPQLAEQEVVPSKCHELKNKGKKDNTKEVPEQGINQQDELQLTKTLNETFKSTLASTLASTLGSTITQPCAAVDLLMEQLRNNPKVMGEVKKVVEGQLDRNMELRGIGKEVAGLSSVDLEDKLRYLNIERVKLSENYAEFSKIRAELDLKINLKANKRLQELKKSSALPPSPVNSPHMKRKLFQSPKSSPVNSPRIDKPLLQAQSDSPRNSPLMNRRLAKMKEIRGQQETVSDDEQKVVRPKPQQRSSKMPPPLVKADKSPAPPSSRPESAKPPAPTVCDGVPTVHAKTRTKPTSLSVSLTSTNLSSTAQSATHSITQSQTQSLTTTGSWTRTSASYSSSSTSSASSSDDDLAQEARKHVSMGMYDHSEDEDPSSKWDDDEGDMNGTDQMGVPKSMIDQFSDEDTDGSSKQYVSQEVSQRMQPVQSDGSEGTDWDEASELEQMHHRQQQSQGNTTSTTTSKSSIRTRAPSGERVAQLTQMIEYQLGTRQGRKPAGAVDIMDQEEEEESEEDEDYMNNIAAVGVKVPMMQSDSDSLASVTYNEDGSVSVSSRSAGSYGHYGRGQGVRASVQVTDMDNTYGTSMWGVTASTESGSSNEESSNWDSSEVSK